MEQNHGKQGKSAGVCSSVNNQRTVLSERRTILYGQTPPAVCRKELAAMAESAGLTVGEFAEKVVGGGIKECLQLLRDYHAPRLPQVIQLFDELDVCDSQVIQANSALGQVGSKGGNVLPQGGGIVEFTRPQIGPLSHVCESHASDGEGARSSNYTKRIKRTKATVNFGKQKALRQPDSWINIIESETIARSSRGEVTCASLPRVDGAATRNTIDISGTETIHDEQGLEGDTSSVRAALVTQQVNSAGKVASPNIGESTLCTKKRSHSSSHQEVYATHSSVISQKERPETSIEMFTESASSSYGSFSEHPRNTCNTDYNSTLASLLFDESPSFTASQETGNHLRRKQPLARANLEHQGRLGARTPHQCLSEVSHCENSQYMDTQTTDYNQVLDTLLFGESPAGASKSRDGGKSPALAMTSQSPSNNYGDTISTLFDSP